jgi:two-component system, OmpR family, sensor kinase
VRLSLVFLFLFLQVSVLSAFGIGSLSYFNEVSSQIRDRWLPETAVLGDLNNLTSDYRIAEAAILLAKDPAELARGEAQLDELDRRILAAERVYAQIPHNTAEVALNGTFAAEWDVYRRAVRVLRSSVANGDRETARALYDVTSKHAYDIASNAFDVLNDQSAASARRASAREDAAYSRARRLILMTMLLAALSVAGAMVYVRRSISAPVLRLAARMRRLAANEIGVTIEGTERQDEIGEMARAVTVFRENAIELIASRHGLERQATMLQEKLAHEQNLMRLQRDFVSMASHEFHTPLTIIDAHAQRLITMKDRLASEDLAARAGKIRRSVSRITHLIRNLIESSRLIDGHVDLYFHPCALSLAPLLREACQLQREISPQAQILEQLSIPTLQILGDANLLSQVFSNLLSNAVKYSPGCGLIKVRAVRESDHVIICVEDQGIGIPAAEVERVFDRYYRGSNAGPVTGTGIGLYFVKTVVELHGGEVTAERGLPAGSRFSVRLPIRCPRAAAHASRQGLLCN